VTLILPWIVHQGREERTHPRVRSTIALRVSTAPNNSIWVKQMVRFAKAEDAAEYSRPTHSPFLPARRKEGLSLRFLEYGRPPNHHRSGSTNYLRECATP